MKQDIKTLPGVGKKTREDYENLDIRTLEDLIQTTPRGYEDRSHRICIGRQNDEDESWTNTFVRAESVSEFGPGRKNVKIIVRDTENNQKAFLMGFNRTYLSKTVFPGAFYHLYANITPYGTGLTSAQFELKPVREEDIMVAGDMLLDQGILPVYGLSGGLTQKIIRRDVKSALAKVPFFDDEIPQSLMDKYHLMPMDKAIREIHFPTSDKTLKEARRALAFREVFYLQLEAKRRPPVERRRQAIDGRTYDAEKRFIESLPFELTDDQVKVLEEIRKDMSGSESMNRLLQGDVGSGKTLVAWVSALHAICDGAQVAFMAPTELLARQHAQVADALFRNTGVTVAFLNGEVHGKPRQMLLDQLKAGNIDLLIGTHALFSKDVEYRNLRYVIIDEQHRFGVEQRRALLEKGIEPDVLLMTATPIPRTLALTVFGNLNVSTIKTMPKGRLPVKTYLVDDTKRDEMYRAVGVEMQRGHQAYFVYPRIDDEGNSDLRDVITMYEFL
ncbi:MAG: DEAD/DEAH box helicase, partial [Spirochaetales bacterium]|nr:DEAD/DEAH box helicase [Spirochaetales bacterium]